MKHIRRRPIRLRSYRRGSLAVFALWAALAAGALSVALRPSAVQSNSEEPIMRIVNEDDVVMVQVPARAVARGEKLSDVAFATIKWPKSRVSSEYITDPAPYRTSSALTPLPKLLPVPVSALTTASFDSNHVTSAIPAGMRGITVRVDAESAVEGWAQSGNYVDVYLVRAGRSGELRTKVIAEDIRILSTERSAQPAASEQMAPKAPTTATLLVTQDQALKIKTAANLGRLTFALRGTDDRQPAQNLGVTERDVIDEPKASTGERKRYQGLAQGADGRAFVLEQNSDWTETLQLPKKLGQMSSPTPTESESNALKEHN